MDQVTEAMPKKELLSVATEKGLFVPQNATKKEIVEMINGPQEIEDQDQAEQIKVEKPAKKEQPNDLRKFHKFRK